MNEIEAQKVKDMKEIKKIIADQQIDMQRQMENRMENHKEMMFKEIN